MVDWISMLGPRILSGKPFTEPFQEPFQESFHGIFSDCLSTPFRERFRERKLYGCRGGNRFQKGESEICKNIY